ncbi:BTAD domain-containing putative transcriptional regulator [Streptomyces sp. NPDC049906]|uniref:AfsR/SARP family transcriptional regulator n=1 Tax=Streptomyces sp. NPDC049906 TaxID=3155656 RepID=UPI003419D492
MHFALLGPLEVTLDGRRLALGSIKQRLLLATLLSRPSETVPTGVLVTALWGDEPPASAAANLRTYAGGLRGALGGDGPWEGMPTTRGGYLLRVPPGGTDVERFDEAAHRGRRALAAGDSALAREELARALAMWRGRVLEGLVLPDVLAAWARGLEESRCHTEEEHAQALLAEGDPSQAVLRMRRLVALHPLRQRAWAHLMLGLHRVGDVRGALEAYRTVRDALVRETGLEPGPELARVHEDVLRQRATTAGADSPPQPPRPRQLPLATADFVGRKDALAALDAGLDRVDGQAPGVVITAVSGMAGVGKTTLALHWAHRVADRFPDGQLHVDLRGFDESGAVSAADALQGFVQALGVPQARVPSGAQARAGLYRSLLASRRMLVVLDNARDSAHVRPLLPGAGESVVVVTSRNRLQGLVASEGARALTLEVLSTEESALMLARRLGPRVAAEPDAAADIVALTGRLPLALAVVAARVADHPAFPLHAFAAELRPTEALLDVLEDSDAQRVLAWSYLALSEAAARLFRLLGLHPGPDLTLTAAAALAGAPTRSVRPLLRELTRLHLLTEHLPGRYLFHDLLRTYAAALVRAEEPPPEVLRARERFYDHCLHRAHAAAVLVQPQWPAVMPVPALPSNDGDRARDADTALAWFAAERRVLLRTVTQAAACGFETYSWQLAWALTAYLAPLGLWQDQRTVQQTALAAAERSEDRVGEAMARRLLARADARLGSLDTAEQSLRRALELYEQLGETTGRAQTLHNYVELCYMGGRLSEALAHGREALRLYGLSGNRDGEARTLNAMGWLHAAEGDYRAAIDHCTRALDRQRQAGDRNGQAATLDSLGFAHHHLARYDRAVACYEEAVDLFRSSADRYHEAETLVRLGDTLVVTGRSTRAEEVWERAATMFEELWDPEADAVRERLAALRGDEGGDSPESSSHVAR